MEYQVPQFIEVEDKIVGPLTLKQFIYIAGGAGLSAVCLFYLPLIFGILLALPIAGLAAALAFYRVNGKPFIEVMEAAFNYYTSSKLFLWKREDPTTAQIAAINATQKAKEDAVKGPAKGTPRLTRGKLSELAWSLDIKKSGGSE